MGYTRRIRVKICGVRDTNTAAAASAAGADAVGLVFVDRSPRHVTIEQAASIVRQLPAFVEPVGLFVNATVDQVRDTAARVGLSTVQLHGSETPEQVFELAPLRVVKAMPFDPRRAAAIAAEWGPVADRLAGWLWDCPVAPNGDGLPGGAGHSFDWGTLAGCRASMGIPDSTAIIVAGGLTPNNVANAIHALQPWAVDVSSGVESERGVKNPERIVAFCQAVRDAELIQ